MSQYQNSHQTLYLPWNARHIATSIRRINCIHFSDTVPVARFTCRFNIDWVGYSGENGQENIPRMHYKFKEIQVTVFIWLHMRSTVFLFFVNGRKVKSRNEYQQYSLEVKGGRCIRLTTLPLSFDECLEILGASTSWNPKDLSRPVQGYFNRYIPYVCSLNYGDGDRTEC